MKWLLAVVLAAFPVLGAEIAFTEPPRLAGTFRVAVTGVDEPSGEVTLVVLRTGEVVRVPLQREGDRLMSKEIHVRRPLCDPEGTPFLSVELGDTIVAATALGSGQSATAKVEPRPPRENEPTLTLERWDDLAMKWVGAEEAGPARLRIVLADASADTTCEPDSVRLSVEVRAKAFTETFDLPLVEDAAASGRFVGEFVTVVEPRDCDLLFRVLSLTEDVRLEAPALGAYLAFRYEDRSLCAPLVLVPVVLTPTDLVLSESCVGEARVTTPERPDEVRWCVDGVEQPVREPVLRLLADAPRTVSVVALVRTGLRWGRAETKVTFVLRVKLSFVAADSGLPATEPWPCTQMLRVKVENVRGDLREIVVGRLGLNPRPRQLPVVNAGEGTFLSVPFRPSDLGFCGGDVLWAQYVDPRGCYSAYVVLQLR